jgi:hypothetical protein
MRGHGLLLLLRGARLARSWAQGENVRALDVHRAHEHIFLVVVQDGPMVRAVEHEQATVLQRAVNQRDANGQEIIVRVRVEGESVTVTVTHP